MSGLSGIRKVLVEVLSDASCPFELVLMAAATLQLDARIDNWFVHDLKKNGSADDIFRVLDVTDTCSARCIEAWASHKKGDLNFEELESVVRGVHEQFQSIFPAEDQPGS